MRKFLVISIVISLVLLSCFSSPQQRFLDFFEFHPTSDVRNLNLHQNEFGIDVSYWMAFECEDSTVRKIAENLQLTQSQEETRGLFGGLNMQPTKWWDTAFIFHSKPLTLEKERWRWYLWYNAETHKAYFLTYDF